MPFAGVLIPQLTEPGVCRSPARVLASQERNQTSARIVWRRSQRRSGDRGKLFWRRIGDFRSRLPALLDHELRKLVADHVDAHVVVVQCAENLLDRFHPLDLPLSRFPELRPKQLEGVAKTLC